MKASLILKNFLRKKRLALAEEIKEKALAWALGRAEANEIDEINILQASLLAMTRAVKSLKIQPHFVLVDGNKIPKDLDIPAQAVVKGDSLVAEISAASIFGESGTRPRNGRIRQAISRIRFRPA